jgi:ribonuclease-3
MQKTGPDHDKTFWIEVHVGERSFGAGKGKNKKEAEQEAARIAFEGMHVVEKPARNEKPAGVPRPTANNRGSAPRRP